MTLMTARLGGVSAEEDNSPGRRPIEHALRLLLCVGS